MRAVIIFAAHSRAVKIITALLWAAPAHAAVQPETIEYRHDGVVLAGHLAYDDESDVSRPGILVVAASAGDENDVSYGGFRARMDLSRLRDDIGFTAEYDLAGGLNGYLEWREEYGFRD